MSFINKHDRVIHISASYIKEFNVSSVNIYIRYFATVYAYYACITTHACIITHCW